MKVVTNIDNDYGSQLTSIELKPTLNYIVLKNKLSPNIR